MLFRPVRKKGGRPFNIVAGNHLYEGGGGSGRAPELVPIENYILGAQWTREDVPRSCLRNRYMIYNRNSHRGKEKHA